MGNNFLKDRILKQSYEDFYVEAKDKFEMKWEVDAKNTAVKEEYIILEQLEMGQFGKGVLVQHKKNKSSFVMKMLDKDKILKSGYLKTLLKEKRILQAANFPFIFNLLFHFKENEKVFMLYEYRTKIDINFSNLIRFEACSEKVCRFYSAQIILALEYLHRVGIIYRDLTPQNILVDGMGYIRIREVSGNIIGQIRYIYICFLNNVK